MTRMLLVIKIDLSETPPPKSFLRTASALNIVHGKMYDIAINKGSRCMLMEACTAGSLQLVLYRSAANQTKPEARIAF